MTTTRKNSETVRCFFIISEEKIENCRYYYIGEDTYTFMMSRYIMDIYTAYQREKRQCWGGQHKVGGDFGSVVLKMYAEICRIFIIE